MSGEDHDYVQGWRDLDSLRLPYAKPHLWKAAVEQDPPTARMAKLKNNPLPSETAYLQSKQKSGSIYAHSISPSSSTSTNRMSGISRSSKKKPRGERSKKRRQHGGMGSSKSTSYLLRHMESSKFVHDTTYEATMADLAAEQLKAQSRHERKKTHDDRRQEDKAQGKRERLKAHSNTVSHFKRIVGSPTRFPRNKLPSGNAESNAFSHTVSFAFPTPSRAAGAAEAAAAALSDFQASLSAAKQQDASKLTAASCVRLPTHHTQPPPQLQQQRTPSISSPTLPTVRTAVDLAAGTPVAPAIALLQQGIGHLTTSLTRVLKLEPHRANFAADKTDKLLITPADRRDAHDAEVVMRNEKARQRLMEYKKMDGTVQEMNLPTVAKWTDIVATRIAELESQPIHGSQKLHLFMASRVDNFLERRKFWDKKWSHDYNSRISSISGILQSRVKQESQNAFVQNQAHLSHAQFIERMHHEAIQRGRKLTEQEQEDFVNRFREMDKSVESYLEDAKSMLLDDESKGADGLFIPLEKRVQHRMRSFVRHKIELSMKERELLEAEKDDPFSEYHTDKYSEVRRHAQDLRTGQRENRLETDDEVQMLVRKTKMDLMAEKVEKSRRLARNRDRYKEAKIEIKRQESRRGVLRVRIGGVDGIVHLDEAPEFPFEYRVVVQLQAFEAVEYNDGRDPENLVTKRERTFFSPAFPGGTHIFDCDVYFECADVQNQRVCIWCEIHDKGLNVVTPRSPGGTALSEKRLLERTQREEKYAAMERADDDAAADQAEIEDGADEETQALNHPRQHRRAQRSESEVARQLAEWHRHLLLDYSRAQAEERVAARARKQEEDEAARMFLMGMRRPDKQRAAKKDDGSALPPIQYVPRWRWFNGDGSSSTQETVINKITTSRVIKVPLSVLRSVPGGACVKTFKNFAGGFLTCEFELIPEFKVHKTTIPYNPRHDPYQVIVNEGMSLESMAAGQPGFANFLHTHNIHDNSEAEGDED